MTERGDARPAAADGGDDRPVIDRGHYDVLGIGLGPFNLGLAALLDGADAALDLDAVFLERERVRLARGDADRGSHSRGAVPRGPGDDGRSHQPHSFLNYVRERDRIYEFYFYETFQIPRREYDAYLRWSPSACRRPSSSGT